MKINLKWFVNIDVVTLIILDPFILFPKYPGTGIIPIAK